MRTMKKWSAVFVALVGTLLLANSAWAGCIEDTEVNSYQVEITPDTECLDISVRGTECTGGVEVVLTNGCDAAYAPSEDDWTCEGDICNYDDESNLIDIPAGGAAFIRTYDYEDDVETTQAFQGTLDGQDLDINVTFDASVTNDYSGCTQAPGEPSASWIAVVLGLLSLGYLNRREGAEAAR